MLRSKILTIVTLTATAIGSSAAQAADKPDVDAKAMAALDKMGAYLRSLSAYRVQAVTTDEDVLEDGVKVQYTESVDILASKPNHLWAEVVSDREREFSTTTARTSPSSHPVSATTRALRRRPPSPSSTRC